MNGITQTESINNVHVAWNMKDALDLMLRHSISGIPVIARPKSEGDTDMKLKGIVTNRDLRIKPELDAKIANIMTSKNLITAREDVDLEKAEEILLANKIEKLLVMGIPSSLTFLVIKNIC